MEPEMKRTLIAAAAVVLATASGLAGAASWTVIVQPGVYGRVAIGGYAEAPMVYAPQPVVAIDNGYGEVVEEVVDPAYATEQAPVYLWVPEYQRQHWAQYCREYGAYGVPVYFVDDGWYRANVMRRNWTPEQRSWSQQQWVEQDRLARDRVERQRFEQQRYEQQQRWNDQRAWRDQQQRQGDDPRGQGHEGQGQGQGQGGWNHDHGDPDAQNRMRWGAAHGVVPPQGQNNPAPRPQQGGQWQQQGGQWQQQGGQWQQNAGNGGAHHGGSQAGNGGSPGNAGGPANGGIPANGNPGSGWNNGGSHGGQQPQPPAASQPRGGSGQDAGDRRGGERGQYRTEDRDDRRGQGDARGAYEHGRDARRDR
jgi:hypothetical protein